ncbi:MAG: glutathione transport system permease protein [Nocardioidaceae bacterium]|nr:glutathione transport system permease protein [Nocardioidaceae bacterium]
MIVYLVRRFINYAILSMLATVLAYVMACLALDPKARYLGRNPRPSDASINHILDRLGTNPNTPILSRTTHWFSQIIFHGNFGLEYNSNSVAHDMFVRSGVSLQLLLLGSILGAFFGVALGVWGAVRQYKASDQVVTYSSYLVLSTPVFVLGVLLMIVATRFNNAVGHQVIQFTGQYTPGLSGRWNIIQDRVSHLFLPTLALSMFGAAEYSRYQRNAMLDVLSADYIRTARSKGRTRGAAMVRHGVRVALIPMSTYFAYSFGTLIAGSTFLEKIFSWHGMGEYALDAIVKNDINATAGSIFYVSVLVLISSTLAEVLYAALDPRVRI